jgi:crossover junction endodeoxyribonuclease RuvC
MQKAGGNSMLALGIDPGTAICGYGVVEMKGSVMKPVFYGSILTDKDWRPEERLLKIHQDVSDIIGHFQPEFMSIEKLYFNRNVNTAIPVAQARGVHCGRPAAKRPSIYKTTKASFEAGHITRSEAAARLGVSTTTFDKWRAEDRDGA